MRPESHQEKAATFFEIKKAATNFDGGEKATKTGTTARLVRLVRLCLQLTGQRKGEKLMSNVLVYAVVIQYEDCFNIMAVHETLEGAKDTLSVLARGCKNSVWKDETKKCFTASGYKYYIHPTVLWK